MPDERRRLASLVVVGGPEDGHHYDPVDVVGEILIGSDPDCHLVVGQPSISPIHARVWSEIGGATVHDTHAPRGIFVKGERVRTEAAVGAEDLLWLGPPDEPGSVCIRFVFEPWVEVLPSAGAAPGDAGTDPFFVDPTEPIVIADPTLIEPASAGPAPEAESPPAPPAVPPVVTPPPAAPPEPDPQDDFYVADAPEPTLAQEKAPKTGAARPAASPVVAAPAVAATGAQVPPQTAAPPRPAQPVAAPPKAAVAPAAPAKVPGAGLRPKAAGTPAKVPGAGLPPTKTPVTKATPPQGAPTAAAPPRTATPATPKVTAAPTQRSPTPGATAPTRKPAPGTPRPPAGPKTPVARAAPQAPRTGPAPAAPRPATPPRQTTIRARPRPARKRVPTWLLPVAVGLTAVVIIAVLGLAGWWMLGEVQLDGVEPARLRVGQKATIRGSGFATTAAENVVLFEGQRAEVLAATPTSLEVEVPELAIEAGAERRVSLLVRRGSRSSEVIAVAVLQGPRLHALSPEVAMPGEEVTLVGAGLGLGATVRFGSTPARILEADATRVRAVVPDIEGGPGTAAPVVVTVGRVDSNPAPFVLGHLPLVTGIAPPVASPGDVVKVSGLGFQGDPLAHDVRIGSTPALVARAGKDTLDVVVPRVGAGESVRAVEVRVSGSPNVATASLEVPAPSEAVEPRFVAEPFSAVPGRAHAVVATGLGPAFVFAASSDRTAAQRALEAQEHLNDAIPVLRATLGLTLEARGLGSSLVVIGLSGRPDVVFEVTDEDAAAYDEDWTGLGGRGGPVTRDRLARWWEAVGRDLVLLLVRGEKPRFAAQLAPEGRVLVQLYDTARKAGRTGVPREVVNDARPALRNGLRLIALRVPARVPATAAAGGEAPDRATSATRASVRGAFEGTLRGSELESGQRRYLTVTLQEGEGTISYEGGLTVTVPLQSIEQAGGAVRFSVRIRGGMRRYAGEWDGDRLVGTISTDASGREVVGSFELRP